MTPGPDLAIAAAQLNPVAGDIPGNVRKIRDTYLDADRRGTALMATPELSVTGQPLEGLLHHPDFLAAAEAGLDAVRDATRGHKAAVIVGAPIRNGTEVVSAAQVFRDGRLIKRVGAGEAGGDAAFELDGCRVGVAVGAPAFQFPAGGADLIVSVNAMPFRPDSLKNRVDAARGQAIAAGVPLLHVNAVGGQDEYVFDGGSFLLDGAGRRVLQLPLWEECVMDLNPAAAGAAEDAYPDPRESLWRALMTGIRDYVAKNGFSDVMLGMSGGMDSALAAALAGDALGPTRVHCVRLPSRHTSGLSNAAAERMCAEWGFPMHTIPIGPVVAAAGELTAPLAPGGLKKLTAENMQARARGYLLMTLSNERNWLLLSTGNKSEIAVGYSTLYGDMCGAYNPLRDVFKTTVYALAGWRNQNRPAGLRGPTGEAVPPEIIARPPSAELSPDQLDTDSLPPYDILDTILAEMVERESAMDAIVNLGFDRATVERVERLVRRAEFKRRQGAPGPIVSRRAFGSDRRMPMTNGFDPAVIGKPRRPAEERG